MAFVLEALGISRPTYLDIGAEHPIKSNNTFLFYKQGGSGICIEPRPGYKALFKGNRHRDLFLNVGVGPREAKSATLYVLRPPTLSTFSKEEARRYILSEGAVMDRVVSVSMVPLNTIFEQYFQVPPDFVSLDVEGLEFEILRAADLSRYRPIVFCVETLSYVEKGTGEKSKDIIGFMSSRGYMLYGDTYINTIFVDEEKWHNRNRRQAE